jgi:hypothetical protein
MNHAFSTTLLNPCSKTLFMKKKFIHRKVHFDYYKVKYVAVKNYFTEDCTEKDSCTYGTHR